MNISYFKSYLVFKIQYTTVSVFQTQLNWRVCLYACVLAVVQGSLSVHLWVIQGQSSLLFLVSQSVGWNYGDHLEASYTSRNLRSPPGLDPVPPGERAKYSVALNPCELSTRGSCNYKWQWVAYMPSSSSYLFNNKHHCNAIPTCATVMQFYVFAGRKLSLESLLWQQWLTYVEGVKVTEATHCLVQQGYWVQAWVRTAWVLHILHTKTEKPKSECMETDHLRLYSWKYSWLYIWNWILKLWLYS